MPTTTAATRVPTAPAPAQLAPARAAPATHQFGVNVNLVFDNRGYTAAQIGVQLQALQTTGATLARGDALWEASEPSAPVNGAHTYSWTFDDTTAGDLAAHRLRWLPVLDYSAGWAQSISGQDHSPPRSNADYAAYAGAFAARYGSGGSFWREHPDLPAEPVQSYEIWNEPDNGEFWTPAPNAGGYADLYIAARVAIDAVDPAARVIVGGLTEPAAFVPSMLIARPELRGHIDGIAVHPYGPPSVVLAKIRADRTALVSLGLESVPLYVTEFGWTTSPPGALDYVPAARRPGYISRTVAALGHLDCGIAASLLYTWLSPAQDPGNSQQFYGIDGLNGGPTPDTAAFSAGLRRGSAAGSPIRLCR